jgi:O-antigen ligase
MTAILQGLMTLLAFLLPFEARRPVVSFAPYMVFTGLELVTLLTVGVWAARAVAQRRAPALPGRLGLLAWGLVGVALLSAVTAPAFRLASLKFTLRMATGVCLLCVVAEQGLSLKALVAGAAVSSALGVWTCLRPDQTGWLTLLFREREFLIGNTIRLSGTFEYPNIAAAFLAMGFTLSLGLRAHSLLWAAARGLILLALIMTLSRAGLAVALLGLCLVAALHAVRVGVGPALRRLGPSFAITALCLAGVSLFYPPFLLRFQTGGDQAWYSARYETLGVTPLSAGGVSTATVSVSRATLWRAGWEMFKRHPALGVGPDNFRRLWGREYGMGRWDERVHANNLFVEVFVTTGLLGGVIFLGLIVSVLRMQVRGFRRLGEDDAAFSVAAALFGATAVFLAHGMVDCFIAFTPIYLLFWAVAGLSARMTCAP